jgi:hypothetical protein
MIKPTLSLLAPLLLAGCITYHVRGDGIARAGLGQSVLVGGPRGTPLEVLEDSRCPMNARCVWAGQVRLKVRIHLGSGDEERELTSNKPVPVADGMLELVDVQPDRVAGETLDPKNYRFGFRFVGGL